MIPETRVERLGILGNLINNDESVLDRDATGPTDYSRGKLRRGARWSSLDRE